MADVYVVTGGGGFIGSNIARELVKRGETVRIVDNFSTGNKSKLDDIADSITLYESDITDPESLKEAFTGATYILHQAALPSVPRSIANPHLSNRHNVEGTLNVLLAARDANVKRVVFASSSSVYGNADVDYKVETLPPDLLSPYALTKYAGEAYCRLFYELYGLETVALRYFNVFGPHQDPNGDYAAVIPKFILMMLNNEAPEIHGDGMQSRDFTFVANNVAANILAATSDKGAGEAFNIACGTNINLNDLVAFINKELGTSITPTHTESRAGDVKHSQADITKARDILGYEPTISVEEGLRQTIAWYKESWKP